MKFCAVVAEYNPFHAGHAYLFSKIREAGYGHILCIMSGNFTQRGEAALFQKYVRARHAVENGADAVIELPTAFAVSPAELFAGGAVHILSALENVEALAFGCESGSREEFLRTAEALLREDKPFRTALKENLKDGTSYIRARNAALLATRPEVDETLLSSPNNILGTEYCRALLSEKSGILPLPIARVGSGHGDAELKKNYSSSTAIREAIRRGERRDRKMLKANLPENVYHDVMNCTPSPFEEAALAMLFARTREEIAKAPDCAEGLENRLVSMAKSNPRYGDLLQKVVSKRYTLSRLKRILAQNLLGVELEAVQEFLSAPLYANVLAVNGQNAEEILSSLSGSIPVIARKSDYSLLKKDALGCFTIDVRANDLYNVLTGTYTNEFLTLFV